MTPDRILILGGPGTGKTTLARTVASARGLPHHELDRIAHQPPDHRPDAPFRLWVRLPDDVRRDHATALAVTGAWVADGLYAGWTAALRDAADVIVWLDLPPRVTTWRVVKRAIEQRRRGGHDWDLRSVVRVARGARSFRRRPLADPEQLRDRDGANGSRTLEHFLRASGDRVIRCRTTRQVRRATQWLTH